MQKKYIFEVGFVLLLLSINAYAYADCSQQAFARTCGDCDFHKGKVDSSCKDGYQTKGQACVTLAYPIPAGKYFIGMCPALEKCIEDLKSCAALRCPGSDLEDCRSHNCKKCYEIADGCAYMAAKDCDDKEICGNGECVKDKGEDKHTCCVDCGCDEGHICRQGECVEGREHVGEIEDEQDAADYLIEQSGGFIWDMLGCFPFLLAPISLVAAVIGRVLLI